MASDNVVTGRLRRRVARQFPPIVAARLIRELATVSFPMGERQDPERLLAAVVVVSDGDEARFRSAIALGRRDWRDLLVAARLANSDWRERLDIELDADRGQSALPDT